MPNLPPVASAVITILGFALAVTRLLTASRPFWTSFPAYVQKGLPALLVALGALPVALEHAKSWLDVAVALVISVSAWFTASRGDKRPPGDDEKPVGPVDRISFSNPNSGGWEPPAAYLVGVALLCVSCAGAAAVRPGCDEAGLAALTAACSLQAYECAKDGGTEVECTAACDERLDERAKACR